MFIRPLEDRIIARQHVAAEESKGGIIIPAIAQEKPMIATAIAVGPGRWENGVHIPMWVKEGDKLQLAKYGGSEFRIDGVDYFAIRERDVIGILVGEAGSETVEPVQEAA